MNLTMPFNPFTVAAIIKQAFIPPFVDEGLVSVRVNERGDLLLKIGPRDVQIDAEGNCVGAGTSVCGTSDPNCRF